MNHVFVFAIGIGIVAGLRSLLAPAVVAWAAHFDLLNLNGSPLAFMGSRTARRDIFHFRHRRVSRRQAAKDSETDRLRAVISAHPLGRP